MKQMRVDADILKLHCEAVIVDGHADTFGRLFNWYALHRRASGQASFFKPQPSLHIDFKRLLQGDVNIQFTAIYTPPRYQDIAAARYALNVLHHIQKAVAQSKGKLGFLSSRNDIGFGPRHKFLVSMEDGSPLMGDLSMLEAFHALGVRSLGLTHNPRNQLGDGIGVKNPRGLTRFGKEVLRRCQRLGIIIDIAHLARPGFRDVMRLARAPVIASHIGVRSLRDIPRNLDDNQIKAIARTKGVIGVFYIPGYIKNFKGSRDRASVTDVADHICYVADKVGVDYVGLGSDFDGYQGKVRGLEDIAGMSNLTKELVHRGFNRIEIKKILGGNFLRVLRIVLR